MKRFHPLFAAILFFGFAAFAQAEVCNLKVVTDASPDYSDMQSMIRSIASRWESDRDRCWAVFYWNHIARRQTTPMHLHGLELADPIRQFNDYGYTMCSTISGINCAIWHHMGLKAKYWDITRHTVSEVFYDGGWHLYDNSLSALYTLCDGKTIAGVEDIGKAGACEASGGREEPGHIAKYHCLTATSPNGFLTGADCARDLDQAYRCFNPGGLKYRAYFYDWDFGHRYILNLKENESYTRFYHSMGKSGEFYVPNVSEESGKGTDPENRFRIRGNGVWVFKPDLSPSRYRQALHSARLIVPASPAGLRPAKAGTAGEAVFKVQSANVTTGQVIKAAFALKSSQDEARILVSATNGLRWKPVFRATGPRNAPAEILLRDEVNGAYEVLIKVVLKARAAPAHAALKSLQAQTLTMLNAKTQPKLNLGKNTVYVGAGDRTESTVFWPELQGDHYKELIVEEKNIASTPRHPGYQGAIYPARAKQDAYLVYRLDAPGEIVRLTYGGRFYNRAPGSRIELLYSLNGGKKWVKSWSLTQTEMPWDVIRYETVKIPAGHRFVWVKYLMNTPAPEPSGCSLYAVRMEADYRPASAAFRPIEVTFNWAEPQKNRTLVERSHTQLIPKLPFTYTINAGGEDHPVVRSLRVNLKGAVPGVRYGYSDGKDAGGKKFVGRWETLGKNLAVGKSYTLSAPSTDGWGAGDPDGRKLTDGVAGPSYAGGTSYGYSALWNANTNPVITLDLAAPLQCASFGMNFHGYEWWDAMKGEVRDRVEVLTSLDGQIYASQGFLHTDWRWKELPVNHMWPDEEAITGATFRLIPPGPVTARYVQYRVTSPRFFACTELEVLDSIRYDPFDLKIALPGGR
ncbi:MAG: hypothetical protein IT210_12775 [Armatimonadetes bacterium]|nr:hypothetical protein [Armatimonadota bacterium]